MMSSFVVAIQGSVNDLGVTHRRLSALGRRTLNAIGLDLAMECSLAIVSQQRMKEINRQYRKKNKPTDVLSFDLGVAGGMRWCEIVLCPSMVRKMARLFQRSNDVHAQYLFVHGLLHALGYDHKNIREAEVMEALEEHIVER